MLFLSNERSHAKARSAYTHRLNKLQECLQLHGFETDYLSLRDSPVSRPILLQPLNYPVARKKLAECDFIHAGGDATFAASLWKPFTRAQIIYDVHGDTLEEAKMEWESEKGLRSAHQVVQSFIANAVQFRAADRFLFVSRPMQDWLHQRKIGSEDHSALIRNGVDLNLFRPASPPDNKDFVVAYAGGFSVWQGLENLVQAVEKTSNKKIRLKIIGVTSGQKSFADDVSRRLGDRVELLGRMDQQKLVSQLGNVDVLVIPRSAHPALRVALPTKFAEYLALGRPLVVSNVDETAELVRANNCGLVSEPNSDDLARTLAAMSELTCAERQRMGDNARQLAEQAFSWEEIGRRYAESLNRWVDVNE